MSLSITLWRPYAVSVHSATVCRRPYHSKYSPSNLDLLRSQLMSLCAQHCIDCRTAMNTTVRGYRQWAVATSCKSHWLRYGKVLKTRILQLVHRLEYRLDVWWIMFGLQTNARGLFSSRTYQLQTWVPFANQFNMYPWRTCTHHYFHLLSVLRMLGAIPQFSHID